MIDRNERPCKDGKHIGPFYLSDQYRMSMPAQQVIKCEACGGRVGSRVHREIRVYVPRPEGVPE